MDSSSAKLEWLQAAKAYTAEEYDGLDDDDAFAFDDQSDYAQIPDTDEAYYQEYDGIPQTDEYYQFTARLPLLQVLMIPKRYTYMIDRHVRCQLASHSSALFWRGARSSQICTNGWNPAGPYVQCDIDQWMLPIINL